MKANRKFVQADEAVSPVIAVILMVAITVVLAATVFVLVSDIGGNTGNTTPAVSWAPDESQDRMGITTAAQNADWFRLTFEVASCANSVAADAIVIYAGAGSATAIVKETDATTGGAPLNTGTAGSTCGAAAAKRVGTTNAKIEAGDYIDFCFGPTTATSAVTNVKVTIKDTTANAIVTSHTFTDMVKCAT